jgi:hypothetical protein
MLILLLITYILLNYIDYWLTQKVLKLGAKEINPIVRWLRLIPSKVIGTIILTTGYILTSNVKIWYGIDFILLGICIWNFVQFKKLGKL